MHPLSSRARLGRAALVALAAGLVATASAAAEAPLAVRLLSPAPGDPLPAGGTAVLAWEAEGLPPGVEEWEAFLSLDGGATYPFRVTPHLDRRITRFLFQVPSLPTAGARLLLRFGDEHREREVDAGFNLTIAPSPVPPIYTPAKVHRGAGEAARPGLEGTVAWIEGPRDGSRVRRVVARRELLTSAASFALAAGGEGPAAEAQESEPLPAGTGRTVCGGSLPLASSATSRRRPPSLAVLDRLALLGRRNE